MCFLFSKSFEKYKGLIEIAVYYNRRVIHPNSKNGIIIWNNAL